MKDQLKSCYLEGNQAQILKGNQHFIFFYNFYLFLKGDTELKKGKRENNYTSSYKSFRGMHHGVIFSPQN